MIADKNINLEYKTIKTFSELSKQLRLKHGLKRARLALELGKRKGYGAYIQAVEDKEVRPSPDMVSNYIRYFNLDVEKTLNTVAKTFLKPFYRNIRYQKGST